MDLYFRVMIAPHGSPVWDNEVITLGQAAQLLEINSRSLHGLASCSAVIMIQGFLFQIVRESEWMAFD